MFHFTQHILKVLSFKHLINIKITNEIYYFLLTKFLKMLFILYLEYIQLSSTSQFQVLTCHMWPVGTMLKKSSSIHLIRLRDFLNQYCRFNLCQFSRFLWIMPDHQQFSFSAFPSSPDSSLSVMLFLLA